MTYLKKIITRYFKFIYMLWNFLIIIIIIIIIIIFKNLHFISESMPNMKIFKGKTRAKKFKKNETTAKNICFDVLPWEKKFKFSEITPYDQTNMNIIRNKCIYDQGNILHITRCTWTRKTIMMSRGMSHISYQNKRT